MTVGRSRTGAMTGRTFKGNKYRPDMYLLAVKTYEVRFRKRDGVPIYWFVEEEEPIWRCSMPNWFIRAAEKLARERGLNFYGPSSFMTWREVKHRKVCTLHYLELLAMTMSQTETTRSAVQEGKGHDETSGMAEGVGTEREGTSRGQEAAFNGGSVERFIAS